MKVCVTTPCMIMGSDAILQAVEQTCCCTAGHVSPDGIFGVEEVQCQGACVNAPVVVVNDDYYVRAFTAEPQALSDLEVLRLSDHENSIAYETFLSPLSYNGRAMPINGEVKSIRRCIQLIHMRYKWTTRAKF